MPFRCREHDEKPDRCLDGGRPLPVLFMTKQSDSKAKTVQGWSQQAPGDLKGTNGAMVKGAAKQGQASPMNTAANLQKASKNGDKPS